MLFLFFVNTRTAYTFVEHLHFVGNPHDRLCLSIDLWGYFVADIIYMAATLANEMYVWPSVAIIAYAVFVHGEHLRRTVVS